MREILEDFARQAGEVIMKHYRTAQGIEKSSRADVVTTADHESEKKLISLIQDKFPGDAIISEESSPDQQPAIRTWIVDPLDGTHNYASRIPLFCVMIAFARDEDLQACAIYNPLTNQMFSAEKGKGAFCNSEKIQCSDHHKLHQSIAFVDFSWLSNPTNTRMMDTVQNLLFVHEAGIKSIWCASMAAASMACGTSEIYMSLCGKVWDYAPTALLLRESGCKVTNLQGDEWQFTDDSLIASNPSLHPLIMEIIHQNQ